jgi:probable HAF family extracellular repeat protein
VAALAITGGSLNGATIQDALGNSPNFTGLLTSFPTVPIDVRPVVTSLQASPATAIEGIGQTITLTVGMGDAVSVSGGIPTLALNDGGTAIYDAAATAALGDPTKLVFDYTVAPTDQSVNGFFVVGGGLNGASITDAFGHIADFSGLLHTSFGGLQIVAAPVVVSVAASPVSGNAVVGQTITLTVAMSEGVTLSGGTPTLALNNGGTATFDAAATAALGDPSKLVFGYTVGATDLHVNSLAIVGGSLNGASITDATGHSASDSGLLTSFPNLAVGALPYVFTTLDLPAVGSSGDPTLVAINSSGQVLTAGGFLYSGGSWTSLQDPAAGLNSTFLRGINDQGQIVGSFTDQSGSDHGLLYSNGIWTTLDDPLAKRDASGNLTGTFASGINDAGQIVGSYLDSANRGHAFLYSGGVWTTLDDPAAGATGVTSASAINDQGQIVGTFRDGTGNHGFLYSGGTWTTLDDPFAHSSVDNPFPHSTIATGINDAGQIVGTYKDSANQAHGFVYQNGAFTTVDDPQASGSSFSGTSGTQALGINDAGQIVGSYFNVHGHGFVANLGIDLAGIAFGPNTTLAYTPNAGNTGGALAVTDGAHLATITLLGQYMAADFHAASDFHGGTLVTDPTLTGAALNTFLASPHT